MGELRPVYVTGVGAISPLGEGWARTWEGLVHGRSGIHRIRRFDPATFPTKIGAEVDWDRPQEGDPSGGHLAGRAIRFALASAREALAQAGIRPGTLAGPRTGVFMGAGNGEALTSMEVLAPLMAPLRGPDGTVDEARFLEACHTGFDARTSGWAAPEAPAAALARAFGVEGPVRTHLTACAASAQALGEAYFAIQRGEIDVALAGGSHAMVHPDGIIAFSKLGALSTRNDDPEHASRPFDATRDGFVLGEGAAVLVLESAEHLRRRGGVPEVELLGYGVTADAFRVTDPEPSGVQAARAMSLALNRARMDRDRVDYVNAHGTSTQANDAIESQAIRSSLGEHALSTPVSSVKSMIGHLIAAAGAIEAAATYETIRRSLIPPTMNYETPDPQCPLDYVPNKARETPVRVAMSNSFGFGGQNVCLVLGKAGSRG